MCRVQRLRSIWRVHLSELRNSHHLFPLNKVLRIEYLEQEKGKSDYDCALAYSGGKDSSYTLYVLREIFNLRVLALVFDNGFLSDQAKKNINRFLRMS